MPHSETEVGVKIKETGDSRTRNLPSLGSYGETSENENEEEKAG